MSMELDFIPDLPAGPLDEYRQSSFNWKRLKLALEGGRLDLLKLKYKVWKTVESDSLFAQSAVTPSVEEQKRITQLQVKRLNEYNFLPPNIMEASYKTKTRMVMTVNEAVQNINPNVSVKMAIGIHLFANTLSSLGTERHLAIYEKVFKREILSCLALTEVAHGSDARLMRTTATYDPHRQEFVVHTPDFEAAKCWVGNLGRTCTHALLFAQLVMPDGSSHGLHAFVVPVRDPATLETYAGLVIGDMGEKIGLNGIDNGFIMFNQYRIPRENLLNRTADVTPDGEYVSCFSQPSRMLGAALENLSAGRLGIMQESCHTISSAVTIAIRYAATRKQFGTAAKEIPLLDYELHQWRLFGHVAAAVVFKIYIAKFTDIYLDTVEKSISGAKIDNLSDIVSEIHAIVSSSKPMVTWKTMQAIQECREACGGHGYLKCANLGELRNNHDPCVTYEGDNNVLSQQAGNWLLRQWEAAAGGRADSPLGAAGGRVDSPIGSADGRVDSPLGTARCLAHADEVLARRVGGDVLSLDFIMTTYEWLLCWLARDTHAKYRSLTAAGLSKLQAKAGSQVYRWKSLTRVYAEYVALLFCGAGVRAAGAGQRPLLERLMMMYGLSCLDHHLVYLYQGGAAQADLAQSVRAGILTLCARLRPDIVGVVDALAPPDYVLNSVLGRADGNLYQNLQRELFHTPGAFERATWWREVVAPPKSKL